MNISISRTILAFLLPILILASGSICHAQVPKNLKIALDKKPVQADVDCDRVPADKYDTCEIASSKDLFSAEGFIVTNPAKQIVRMYTKEGTSTHWTFFKNGQEVYRETDTNGNKKPDEFRWLDTAGSRIGKDSNEDGVIDRWVSISAEEAVSYTHLTLPTICSV